MAKQASAKQKAVRAKFKKAVKKCGKLPKSKKKACFGKFFKK